MGSVSIYETELYSKVLTLFISMFSTSKISCFALKFKPKAEETFDDLKKSFESFLEQDPSGRPQNQTQENFKTHAKWRFTTCSTNKSWTLNFLPKNAYLIGMRT